MPKNVRKRVLQDANEPVRLFVHGQEGKEDETHNGKEGRDDEERHAHASPSSSLVAKSSVLSSLI